MLMWNVYIVLRGSLPWVYLTPVYSALINCVKLAGKLARGNVLFTNKKYRRY